MGANEQFHGLVEYPGRSESEMLVVVHGVADGGKTRKPEREGTKIGYVKRRIHE